MDTSKFEQQLDRIRVFFIINVKTLKGQYIRFKSASAVLYQASVSLESIKAATAANVWLSHVNKDTLAVRLSPAHQSNAYPLWYYNP